MKIFLRVPYHERFAAKARGAHWDPQTRNWYVVSSEALNACKQWSVPLTDEQRGFVYDPVRKLRYQEAMREFKKEKRMA